MLARTVRAKRYKDRAAECLQLAEISSFAYLREQYEQLAGHYHRLAAAEDRAVAQHAANDPQQTNRE